MARLPVGVIGVGALGQHHARHLARSEDAELVGVHDIDPARGQAVASRVGTRFFAEVDQLLERVEAVTIAVPTPAHTEVGLRAIDRGCSVLLEKPMAASLADADRLLAAAARHGVQLQVGHVERFNRAIRAARPYLGELRYFESTRLAPFQPRGTDVAVVLDLMIHDLDLILHLTGSASVADLRASGVAVLTEHLDVANARVEFETGAAATITSSRVARDRVRKLRMFQPDGYFSLDLALGSGVFMRLKNGRGPGVASSLEDLVETIPLEAPELDALGLELQTYVRSVKGHAEHVVTGAEGRAALALALDVSRAVRGS
ncbi:MAG: Gfo/Idh/MocA family oxidoreductase [Gemmatimonadales bacterium]